jgi:8-oxo-dGTP pyrophosphatase MutT (NUDIX family)
MPFGDPRTAVRERVLAVTPHDEKEAADQQAILAWIDSGEPLFRTAPPATPPKHLAVYFALVDEASRCLLLVDHIKARAWLLPGGHVDDGEDPQASAQREAAEELQITPEFHEELGGGQPLFVSLTQTRGEHSPTDVTLWFTLKGDRTAPIRPDQTEFSQARWFDLDATNWPDGRFDPHMERFVRKLTGALDAVTHPQRRPSPSPARTATTAQPLPARARGVEEPGRAT